MGAGLNEPTEPSRSTRPHRRSSMPGRHARASSVMATTLTMSILVIVASPVSANGP